LRKDHKTKNQTKNIAYGKLNAKNNREMRQHSPEELKIIPVNYSTGQNLIITLQKYEKKLQFHLGMGNSQVS